MNTPFKYTGRNKREMGYKSGEISAIWLMSYWMTCLTVELVETGGLPNQCIPFFFSSGSHSVRSGMEVSKEWLFSGLKVTQEKI